MATAWLRARNTLPLCQDEIPILQSGHFPQGVHPGKVISVVLACRETKPVRKKTPGLSVPFPPSTRARLFHTKPQRRGSHRAGQWITDIDPIANPFVFTSVSTWVWERGGFVQLWLTVTLGRHLVSFLGSEPFSCPRQELGGFF